MTNTENTMTTIPLHDNRVGGKTAEISIEEAVRRFQDSTWNDEDARSYYPWVIRWTRFVMFEIEVDGCKFYGEWPDDLLKACHEECKRQNDGGRA